MGKKVRRVPIDFDWPLNKIWQGYLRPEELDLPVCVDCNGRGCSLGYRWLHPIVYFLSMLCRQAKRPSLPMHPWLREFPIGPDSSDGPPTPDLVELVERLAGEEYSECCSFPYLLQKKLIRTAGLPENWGACKNCSGRGYIGTPEQWDAYDRWEPQDPPIGDGWQLWETLSEGSPISPVFPSSRGLARWISLDSESVSFEEALDFVEKIGLAFSFGIVNGKFVDGIELVTRAEGVGGQ